ncbi:hypothetical protein LOTGIDRAFT_153511 [Lottia gigantea]|uniref:Uncharacterized protein n=1 Tax=Lottia gigantea TaxID=225164 RepID=V4AFW0_LOTGI|nr:hypothetical protein LOTGIDRAFT_153511 [Lottia gigantea]ESO94030.1 hypothetical protein LOTGIDRAFT_153511 [Lottia gigantea]
MGSNYCQGGEESLYLGGNRRNRFGITLQGMNGFTEFEKHGYRLFSFSAGASGIGDEICFCLCDNPETFHLPQTAEETQAFIEDFKKEVKIKLLVNKKNLSSTVSRKGSIVDNRPSAAYVGSLGIIMLLVVFISLVLLDLPRGIAFYKALKYQQ